MRPITIAFAALALLAGATGVVAAEPTSLQVPQSIRVEHEQILNRLARLEKHDGAAGLAAQKAAAVLKQHYAKEEEFVLPPLGLLPRIAKGEIGADMEPAIAMANRTKAALKELQEDHAQITAAMGELIEAGKRSRDEELVRFATQVAAQSLNDIEVAQPAAIFIGEYLRQRLSQGH